MARQTIATVTPTHPARARNGMLDRALRSIQMQTLLPDQILVTIDHDGEGAAPTRDRALRLANTDWVAFLDSDDMFLQKHLEKLMAHAQETGADIVYSWFDLLDQNGHLWGDKDPIFPPGHFLNPFDPLNPIETTITTLARTELAQAIGFAPAEVPGGTNPGSNSGEDRRFIHQAIALGANIQHLVERTWIWHHHGGNSSGIHGRGDAVMISS